ncbi:MAG TPA: restriction endonuclease subunit S [Candidatus Paenibacillus intestinavium]|nr:restriction endonuclease subunit S [Candidatus Paenibacillus intestinavium]
MTNRAMKDSGVEWIGAIPEDWEILKYKRFAKSGMGSTLLKEDVLISEEPNSVPVYSATQTDKHFGYLQNPKIVLEKGDLVIPARGNSIGNTKIIKEAIATCTQTTIYSKLNNKIDNRFLYYCSIGLKEYWFFFVQTAIPQITVAEVQNNLVPFTSMKEQKKIAAFLDEKVAHIDNIIEDTKKSIENLKFYKQSLITETVTKGLDSNVEMKDSGIEWIGEIPSHWDTVKMKRLGNIRNGLTYKPIDIVDSEEGILVLRSGNIQNSQLSFQDNVHVKKEINPDLIVSKGDILICSRNGSRKLIGKNAIIEDDLKATFGAFMMLFRPNELPKYIYYILNSEVFNFYLGTFLTSTINQLTKGNFENMKIVFCPDTDEQGKIVAFLNDKVDKLNSMIQDKEKLLNEFESYKKSLIYEYVTGKKEVE